MAFSNRKQIALYISLTILFILKFIPFLFPESRLWGVNHLLFLPDSFVIIYAVIGILIIIAPTLTKTDNLANNISASFENYFYKSKFRIYFRIAFVGFFIILFVKFAMPIHLLGDGYAWLKGMAVDRQTMFKWSEAGSTYIIMTIQNIIGAKSLASSRLAYQLISWISGAWALFYFFLLAKEISEIRIVRLIAFTTMLFSGSLALFFGYVEHYSPLWIALPAFIYHSIIYLKDGRHYLYAALFLIFGILMHLQMAVFIPAFIFVSFSRGWSLKLFLKFKTLIYGIAAIAFLAGIYLFILKSGSDLYFQNMFLFPFEGKPVYPDYFVFSLPHLIDIINQYLLLIPLLPVVFIIVIGQIKQSLKNKLVIFLMLMAMASFLFILLIDPKLGLPRDWDLFSLTAISLVLLFASTITEATIRTINRNLIPILGLTFLLPLPFFVTTLTTDASIRYYEYIIRLDNEISYSSLITIRDYYQDTNQKGKADSVSNSIKLHAPNNHYMQLVDDAIRERDLDRVRTYLSKVIPNKYSANYHNLISSYNYVGRNYEKALAHIDSAITLQRYNFGYYSNRAQIYIDMREFDKALESLYHGYNIDSTNSNLLEGLARLYFYYGKYDSAYVYNNRLSSPPVSNPIGYYLNCVTALKEGNLKRAREAYDQYIRFGATDPRYKARVADLESRFGQ